MQSITSLYSKHMFIIACRDSRYNRKSQGVIFIDVVMIGEKMDVVMKIGVVKRLRKKKVEGEIRLHY